MLLTEVSHLHKDYAVRYLIFPYYSVLLGTWLCGKMHGEGQLTWPDGRIYRGSFRQNHQCGYGSSESPGPSGSVYEGSWKDGKMNGYGILKYSTLYSSSQSGFNLIELNV